MLGIFINALIVIMTVALCVALFGATILVVLTVVDEIRDHINKRY